MESLLRAPPSPARTKLSRDRHQKAGTARVPARVPAADVCLPARSKSHHACTPKQPEEDAGPTGSGASGRDYRSQAGKWEELCGVLEYGASF